MDRQRRLRALIAFAAVVAAVGAGIVARGRRPLSVRQAGDGGVTDAAPVLPPLQTSPVFIANHGKLVGAFNGFAWVAGSDGVRIDAPNPCNERACFRGTDGVLCARGEIAACAKTTAAPCPRDAWALKIGWDVHRDGRAWGPSAKPFVSLDFRGATHARLAVHRGGDPVATEYCVEDYVSGELVGPERFHAECWKERGEPLASFESVDKFILELPAAGEPASFDVCITGIRVAEPVDASGDFTRSAPDPDRTSAAATPSRSP